MDQKTYTLEAPYLGLSNIGATCYMNSVLSTLFMTPEFRRGIYLWKYIYHLKLDTKRMYMVMIRTQFHFNCKSFMQDSKPRSLII